ncbi:uncharacterized protein LOC119547874 [Drosophila subpulchrella]|uniref:uncharacterized protein LOC119547874 n=1 Tax=Drosophila subpulchrella TaxID=1486046 RepID=UPI0018A15CCB|nr:uncharacterized protein LOC119547874 [Drosophila subpulchrella]
MDDCLPGPSRKYLCKMEKVKTLDPIPSCPEFPRPRGPMRRISPDNDEPAYDDYDDDDDEIEVPRVRRVKRTVKNNKLVIPKGRKRPNTKVAVKKKRAAATKKTGQGKTVDIPGSDKKQSTEDPKPEGSNSWLFWKRWFCNDP